MEMWIAPGLMYVTLGETLGIPPDNPQAEIGRPIQRFTR
jgi:hypothetical protein